MREIRPIKESEGEDFLRLLSDVFELDFNRAYDLFFTEPMFDLGRKWALFEGQDMISCLTTTPLTFGWGRAIGIAGVATREARRNEGYARRLMEQVIREYERRDEGAVMLFARETKLYEHCGFEALDRVVRGKFAVDPSQRDPSLMSHAAVEEIYNAWAEKHPDRLRRDELRWRYWHWHHRRCSPYRDGYLCTEPGVMREAIFSGEIEALPLDLETEFFGLTFMADQLGLQFSEAVLEMTLMGRNVPGQPQMFLTDQF